MTGQRDPYLHWAEATGFRYHGAPGSSDSVAVAYECRENARLLQAAARLGVRFPWNALLPEAGGLRFGTARVPRDRLAAFEALVERVELGMPVAQHAGDWTDEQVEPVPASARAAASPAAGGGRSDLVVGIIDDDFAVGHAAFRDDRGTSRFTQVWSQDAQEPQDGLPWQPARGLHGWVLRGAEGGSAHRRWRTHGTHVASLAAGRLGVRDAAAEAELVGVRLPRRTLADTSGGALGVQALEAVHFILRSAGRRRVVVNLSYGTWAGAHDGRSILEEALDELVLAWGGRLQVVVPAGNQYEARAHATGRISAEPQVLRWQVLPDDGTPSFLEIWLPHALAPEVTVTLTSPHGQVLQAGYGEIRSAEQDRQVAWSIVVPRASAGSRRCVALVALSPTTDRGGPTAPHGVWQVELRSRGAEGEFHAWIERDDRFTRGSRGRPSWFLQPQYVRRGATPGRLHDEDGAIVRRDGSFNTIATGRQTLVVGGYDAGTGRVAWYSGSARGLDARAGPDVLAASEDGRGLHGLLGAAGAGVGRARMNGTSVAAPQVARAVANWLAATGPWLPAGRAPAGALPGVYPHRVAREDEGADAPWRLLAPHRR